MIMLEFDAASSRITATTYILRTGRKYDPKRHNLMVEARNAPCWTEIPVSSFAAGLLSGVVICRLSDRTPITSPKR